jgi:hypothetical protein
MHTFPKLKRVEESGYRLYETPEGNFYPSITTVLGHTVSEEKKAILTSWQNSLGVSKAAAYTKAAASKGTNVHTMIERYLLGQELNTSEFSYEDVNVFNALKLKLNRITDVIGLEAPLYSDLLELAGTTDCIGTYKGIPSIIDFKTSCRIKSEKDIADYKLQCCFYGVAMNEKYGTDIDQGVILMSSQTGFPQEFTFRLSASLNTLIERVDHFYSKLAK